jgi:hypothetical protein
MPINARRGAVYTKSQNQEDPIFNNPQTVIRKARGLNSNAARAMSEELEYQRKLQLVRNQNQSLLKYNQSVNHMYGENHHYGENDPRPNSIYGSLGSSPEHTGYNRLKRIHVPSGVRGRQTVLTGKPNNKNGGGKKKTRKHKKQSKSRSKKSRK